MRARRLAGVATVLLACVSCSGSSGARAHEVDVVRVQLVDFRVHLTAGHLVAGPTLFDISNRGPTEHETLIIRTSLEPDQLPMDASGIRLNEDSDVIDKVLDLSGVDLGDHVQRTVDLAPGHYIVFCNLPGHFLGGMHAGFDVSPGPPG